MEHSWWSFVSKFIKSLINFLKHISNFFLVCYNVELTKNPTQRFLDKWSEVLRTLSGPWNNKYACCWQMVAFNRHVYRKVSENPIISYHLHIIIISYHHHIIITISSFNVFYLTVNWTWSLICSCLSLSSQPNVWKDFGWWSPPADLFLSWSEKCSAGGGGFKHFLPYSGQWFIFLITYSSRV